MLVIIIVLIITLFVLYWWTSINNYADNIARFDGSTAIEIPVVPGVDQQYELKFDLKYPKEGVSDGIVLFTIEEDKFQIVYIQGGKLFLNTNNDKLISHIVDENLDEKVKSQVWTTYVIPILNEFKDPPIFFGGAPDSLIPDNNVLYDGQTTIVQFPKTGLNACTNNCSLNNVNISTIFRQHLKKYC